MFFYHVLEGLRGKAANQRGEVSWSRLADHVAERVTKEVPTLIGDGAKQTPQGVANFVGPSPILVGGRSPLERLFIRGMDLSLGRGVPRDWEEAARCFREGADKGHALCEAAYAWHLEYGAGVPRDLATAQRLSTQSPATDAPS